MADGVPARLDRTQLRKFGLTVGPAFAVLGGVLLWRRHETAAAVAGSIAALLIAAALVAPQALGPIERSWMRFAHALSAVTTPLIMGLIYFLVFAPVGIFMRAIGRNPLRHTGTDATWWVSREREHGRRGGMDRQF